MLILVSMSMASLGTPAAARGCEALSPAELSARLYAGGAEPLTEEGRDLYERCVGALLKEDLWTERDAYDAGHYLMIPMHYAFRSGDLETVKAFSAFFSRFVRDAAGEDRHGFSALVPLTRHQFLYLSSQFIALCSAYGKTELIPDGLAAFAERSAWDYLENGTLWDGSGRTSVLSHIRFVLDGGQYSKSYLNSIDDGILFPLAILCDLRCAALMEGTSPSASMDEAADLAWRIFSSPLLNTETAEGGWLYQPGVMYDHSDFAYAGNASIQLGMEPKLREDVPADSSHSHRFPLWLRSFLSAQTDGGRQALFFLRRHQLANQLVNRVLQKVDGQWLCSTFMDGTNGVYRYEYHEGGVGLAGYDLSGTFLLGWWSLLDDGRITAVYQDILKRYPMKGDRSNPYFDHATVREQNPFFDADTAFDNGMFECMTACAAALRPAA